MSSTQIILLVWLQSSSYGNTVANWKKADREVMLADLLDTVGKELDVTILGAVIDKTKSGPRAPKQEVP